MIHIRDKPYALNCLTRDSQDVRSHDYSLNKALDGDVLLRKNLC
jgi:hypothetical protein